MILYSHELEDWMNPYDEFLLRDAVTDEIVALTSDREAAVCICEAVNASTKLHESLELAELVRQTSPIGSTMHNLAVDILSVVS